MPAIATRKRNRTPRKTATRKRNSTPPEIARRYGVAVGKVTKWIRDGELRALNLASSGCHRPRYSVPPEWLEEFERQRQVVPPVPRVRRPRQRDTKDYFPDL